MTRLDLIKKNFIYKAFIIARTKFMDNEKLITRLTRRGHQLDKTLMEKKDARISVFEAEQLLNEYAKRNLKSNDITKWIWNLVYKAKFKEEQKNKKGSQAKLSKQNIKNLKDTIIKRRSIRSWGKDKINIQEIIEAIDISKWAPNSCNKQPWKFLIITNNKNKIFLEDLNKQRFYKNAPIIIVPLIKISEYRREEEQYAYLDAGAIIQNLLLILHSMGFGACWIGIKKEENYMAITKKFCKNFKIGRGYIPISIIPVGKSNTKPIPPARKQTSSIIIVR